MARQTKERAEQTREAILEAAGQVFFARGVARASLEEIAQAARVTRGAVYWHFRDKPHLFTAIEERLREPQEAHLAALLKVAPPDAFAALESAIVEAMTQIETDPRMRTDLTVVLLRADYADDMAQALERQAAYQRRFYHSVLHYFRDIVPPPAAGCGWGVEMAAQLVHTLVQGTILRALRFPTEYPLQPGGIEGVRAFMKALRTDWTRT